MEAIDDTRPVNMIVLSLLALLVGLATGVGAVIFRSMMVGLYNLFFYGQLSLEPVSGATGPLSPFGFLIILVPVAGGLAVVWMTRRFAPETRGGGINDVIDAVYHREGRIRPRVAVVKTLSAALSIGSGASVGREGPIVQIGAAIGSGIAQFSRLPSWQRITLLAAGASAGISATFNTPLGAVLFALELILPEISARTFLPVVIATGSATYVGRVVFGSYPAFVVPQLDFAASELDHILNLGSFVVLGLLAGLVAWSFIRTLLFTGDVMQRRFPNEYMRAAVGMTGIGLALYLFGHFTGHYYIVGGGYDAIAATLEGQISTFLLLAALCVAQILATSVSIGAGASGGVFAPLLFVGAALGGAFGVALHFMGIGEGVSVVDYALIGMAAVVAGGTGAVMTAITMNFELTRDYGIIVPLIIAVAIATGMRRALMADNVFTADLARKGRPVPKDRYSNLYLVRSAREVMDDDIAIMPADAAIDTVAAALAETRMPHFLILEDKGRILGVVPRDHLRRFPGGSGGAPQTMRDLAVTDTVIVRENNILEEVIRRIGRRNATLALVVRDKPGVPRPEDVMGIIGKSQIADTMLRTQMG
ncbi:chloride channel protein [uncultured Parvibaculum sp.]|uniref:chloride channel protein n=1 Tax=uncultured Parvibaculum sp. TaxID=291828 RepID=UPI0030ECB41D